MIHLQYYLGLWKKREVPSFCSSLIYVVPSCAPELLQFLSLVPELPVDPHLSSLLPPNKLHVNLTWAGLRLLSAAKADQLLCFPSIAAKWVRKTSVASGLWSWGCSSSNPRSVTHSLAGTGKLITSLRFSFFNYKITIIRIPVRIIRDASNKVRRQCR